MSRGGPHGRRGFLGAGLALGAAIAGGLGVAVMRRVPELWFIPAPPSRVLSTEGFVAAPARPRLRVLYVGHSLVNTDMPAMARSVARGLGIDFTSDAELIDGGSLERHWKGDVRSTGVRARDALARGDYDVVVLTEAVNLDDHLRWSAPATYAARWFGLARTHRADASLYFYETWHHRDRPRHATGLPLVPSLRSWREHLDSDLGKWEHIVDRAIRLDADARPGAAALDVHLVPGGQALAALVDAIRTGEVPGLADEATLFADEIHLTDLGNYFVALVHVATLARTDVSAATAEVVRGDGTAVSFPPATASALARIAQRAVHAYPRSGVLQPPTPSRS